MRRLTLLIGLIATACGATACQPTPTLIRPTTSAQTVSDDLDYVMTWRCPADGTTLPMYTNDEGYRELPPTVQDRCTSIPPTRL